MLARLYVIIESEDIKDYQMIKDLLLQINPNFSISPSREYAGKKIVVSFCNQLIRCYRGTAVIRTIK